MKNFPTPIPETIDNISYHCSECSSLIEIISINEKYNEIEFKCANNTHNREKIKMPIKDYLKRIEMNNNKKINNKCEIHKEEFLVYCFNCSKHLCKKCLKGSKIHINHNKKIILEIQPNEEDLDIIKKIYKEYDDKIINLKNEKLEDIEDYKLNNERKEIGRYVKKMYENKKKHEKELENNKNEYINRIKEIKIKYEKEIKERKIKYDNENESINNKYKLKNNNEIIFLKHKLELLKKKIEKKFKYTYYEHKIQNIIDVKKLIEIVYNTYINFNENYFYSINIQNIISNYKNNNNTIINDENINKCDKRKNYIIGEIIVDEEKKEVRLINSYMEYVRQKQYSDWEYRDNAENEKIENNCQIYINNKKIEFSYIYEFEKRGKYIIKYVFLKNLTNTDCMFADCNYLINLDLSNFNTENVTSMIYMFSGCKSLKNLNLSNFKTQNVGNMCSMFSGCKSLTNLDVSDFKTQEVGNMNSMFSRCKSLTNLDLSNFSTKNVWNMSDMFYGCNSLKFLDLSNFTTEKVWKTNDMFFGCNSLKERDLLCKDKDIFDDFRFNKYIKDTYC